MTKVNYEEEYVVVNGGRYSLKNDLTYMDSYTGQKPYIRKNTKLDVYRRIKRENKEYYDEVLSKKYWFRPYFVQLEKDFITTDEVSKYLINKNTEEIKGDTENSMMEVMNKLSSKIDEISKPSRLEESMIDAIINKGKDLATEDLKVSLEEHLKRFVEETYGALPTRLQITNNEVTYEKVGIFHETFESVLKLVNMDIPVMLTGGAGTGKNYMLEQVSDALNLSFYYTSTITQEYKLTGFIDGAGRFHETEFYKAFTGGGIFMLDEIDASIPECLVILNGAIANRYFDFPNGRELAHEDFRVVAAGNTVGLGADMIYTGRNVLDGASLDRFVLVQMNYDNRIEKMLCQDETLLDFLYDVRNSVNKNKINHIVGMRTFKYSYQLLMNDFDKKFIIDSVILKGVGEDDRRIIKESLNTSGDWVNNIK